MSRGLSTAFMVAGGALNGLGEGILFQVKAQREAALKQLEIDAANQRSKDEITSREGIAKAEVTSREKIAGDEIAGRAADTDKQIGAAGERNTATITGENQRNTDDINMRRGLLSKTFIGDDGHEYGITADGTKKDLGPAAKSKDMTAEEKTLIDGAIKTATEVNPDTGKSSVNQEKLSAMLLKSSSPAVRNFGKMVSNGTTVVGPDDFSPQTPSPVGDVDADNPAEAEVTPGAQAGAAPKGSDLPSTAAETDPAKQAQAEEIRADYKSGKISRQEANRRLNQLLGG
jgi:hypothetical protein